MTEREAGRAALVFVESNTSGTGRLFVRIAREMGFRPVLVTARPEKYAYLAGEGAPEVIVSEQSSTDSPPSGDSGNRSRKLVRRKQTKRPPDADASSGRLQGVSEGT